MVYGMAWRGMSRYVERHSITCFKALPWTIVPFTRGVTISVGGLVQYRTCSQVEGILHVFSVHSYSCSLWAGIVNRAILNL